MQIEIQTRSFALTEALRSHAERRLHCALSRCDNHIQRVVVRLYDINGPRGGADKCCHLHVVLAHLPDLVVEDTQIDLYAAIDRATERAARRLVRQITRKRTLLRQVRHPVATAP